MPRSKYDGRRLVTNALAFPALLIIVSVAATAHAQPASGSSESTDDVETPIVDAHGLRPGVDRDELVRRADAARTRGFAYLIGAQNKDGSFGTHDARLAKLSDFGFQLRHRGSQDGVRMACTALAAQALYEKRGRSPSEDAALARAIDDLVSEEKFAYEPGESFNTWGYGYKLDFIARLLADDAYGERHEAIRAAAGVCVDGLRKYQQHEGGWGYYSGQMNDFESMSFNTAVFAVALDRARAGGVEVPGGMIDDAVEIVLRQRLPDGSFVYSSSHVARGSSALMNLGSGSRTVACAFALHALGRFDADDLALSLDVFATSENYLESGRKLIIPHSAPHAISGYFFFFGYYYAAEVATSLREHADPAWWDRCAWTMLRTQEANGSWWDTASGTYGETWGTAFALLTLGRYVDAAASDGGGS